MKTGMELIAQERVHLEQLGLTESQQDIAASAELAGAAACYALSAAHYFGQGRLIITGIWPLTEGLLDLESDELTRLARAGALIEMELERIQRGLEKSLLILPGVKNRPA